MKRDRHWTIHLSDKPVTASRQRLNEPRRIGRVTQGIAESQDCVVEAHVKVHKSIRRPKLVAKLIPGNDFAGVLQQHGENLKGLLLQPESDPVFMQLAGCEVDLEGSEVENRSRIAWNVQRSPNCEQSTTSMVPSKHRESADVRCVSCPRACHAVS